MRKVLFMLAAVMLMGCAGQNDVEKTIARILEQYPQAEMPDVYKTFYQDRFGPGHMITDTAAFREYTTYELQVAAEDTVPNLYYEPTGAQGRFVRVYLRCVNEGLLTSEQLMDAFLRSAQPTEQPQQSWAEEWAYISLVAAQAGITCSDEDSDLLRQAAEANRAIHHSDAYRNAYHPHYRIVRRDIFDNEIKEQISNRK